jgi:hypothetical protein
MNAKKLYVNDNNGNTLLFPINALEEFSSISLLELDSSNLLDRFDKKYILTPKQLFELLPKLNKDYSILDIDSNRIFLYDNYYFDTKDLKFYYEHHNGKLNRYKVRYRKYVETNTIFFEMKKKDNTNKTIKERLLKTSIENPINGGAEKLIEDRLKMQSTELLNNLRITYNRITLLNKTKNEKLTFDINLKFEAKNMVRTIDNLVIAESKTPKLNYKTKFTELVSENRILCSSLSKYCLGIVYMQNKVKSNMFKSQFLRIHKLTH